MTKHTHTEGPWLHHKSDAIGGGTIHTIQAGPMRGITVCTIRAGIDKGNSDRIDPVCEANARLIASAPELLAIAVAAHDMIAGDLVGAEWKRACADFLKQASDAISKAT